jgi:alginate O-acetyltransferase complex protein AlgI
MEFNSSTFFLFLPTVLLSFYVGGRYLPQFALKWFLALSSLAFCGWYVPWYALLLVGSTTITYLSGTWMKRVAAGTLRFNLAFYFGLLGALANLIYWKYSAPILELLNTLQLAKIRVADVILPLGISFYTFRQLVYVLDGRAQKLRDYSFTDYFLHIVFFPTLPIGPMVRYDELIPQLARPSFGRFRLHNLIIGSLIFCVGFGKKTLLADNLGLLVDPIFADALYSRPIGTIDAWLAAFAYTLQLYFDFSGYSDMAIGIARMFGIRLPENFHSPLKATTISDFWRGWHITLTRITTSYVFTPVSIYYARLARKWRVPRIANIFLSVAPASLLTFVLVGLWHGATLNFILWGALHGCMVIIEYLYLPRLAFLKSNDSRSQVKRSFLRAWTLLFTVVTLALARSPTLPAFSNLSGAMLGTSTAVAQSMLGGSILNLLVFVIALLISQFAPNSAEIFKRYKPVIQTYSGHWDRGVAYGPRLSWGLVFCAGALLTLSLFFRLNGRASFIYAEF